MTTDAKAMIEFRDSKGRLGRIDVHWVDGDTVATEVDLLAAGYVPVYRLLAVEAELGRVKAELDHANGAVELLPMIPFERIQSDHLRSRCWKWLRAHRDPHRAAAPPSPPVAPEPRDFEGDGGLMPGDQWRDAVERALGVEPDPIEHTPAWAYERVLTKREIGNGVRDESGCFRCGAISGHRAGCGHGPPVAPEPAQDHRLAHALASPPGPRHARLVEPAQEAGGVERVSHAGARDCLRGVAGKREHDTLWRYIDQQLLQQEAAGRERDELRDRLVRAIALTGNWRVAIEGALGVEGDDSEHTPQWAYERVLAIREIGNGVRNESGPIDPFAAEYLTPRCATPGCIYSGGHLNACFDPALREQPECAVGPLTGKQLALLLRRLSDVCFATGGKVTHFELAWLADQLDQAAPATEGRSA